MSQSEESRAEIVVARGDWEGFIYSLERLMSLHQKALQRIRDLKVRNEALRTELRSAISLPTIKQKPETRGAQFPEMIAVQRCRFCNREIEISARFCDACGSAVVVSVCECGRELGRFDRFCDSCGRPVSVQ